jgi:ribosomal protein S19
MEKLGRIIASGNPTPVYVTRMLASQLGEFIVTKNTHTHHLAL